MATSVVANSQSEVIHGVQPESWRWRSRTITYQLEWVLCGKSNCSAQHGPYWYAYWTAPRHGEPYRRARKFKLYIGRTFRSLGVEEVRRREDLRYTVVDGELVRDRDVPKVPDADAFVDALDADRAEDLVVPKKRVGRRIPVPKTVDARAKVPKVGRGKVRGRDRGAGDRAVPKKRKRPR